MFGNVDFLGWMSFDPTSGTITGGGTLNQIAMFTPNGTAVGDSLMAQDALATKVQIAGNFIPDSTLNARTLGEAASRWNTLYMASNIDYSNDLLFNSGGTQRFRMSTVGDFYIADNKNIDVEALGGQILNVGVNNALVINIGTGLSPKTINVGSMTTNADNINIYGNIFSQQVTNLLVKDKLFTVNDGGAAASGFNAGFEIEEGGINTGWFMTNAARNGWDFRVPAIGFTATLSLANLTAARTATLQNASGTLAYISNITITAANNGLSLIGTTAKLGGILIQPTIVGADSTNFFDLQDDYGSFIKTRDIDSNFSIADFGGNAFVGTNTNIFSYLSTGNTYTNSNIVVNFGSIGAYDNAVDTWNFGDNSIYTNTTQSFVLGRANDIYDSANISVFGNGNVVGFSTDVVVVGHSNAIVDSYQFYIGNSNKNLTVDGITGRILALYPTSLSTVFGHTFAAVDNTPGNLAFHVGNSGLSNGYLTLYNGGSFAIGNLAGPVQIFSGDGATTFQFGGGIGNQKVGINIAPSASLQVQGENASAANFALIVQDSAAVELLSINNAGLLKVGGDIVITTAGDGIYIKEGANATSGVATLVAGTVTVNTTKVTANSRIQLTGQTNSLNLGSYNITARVVGTSFTITSLNILDTNNVAWVIIEPAP